jgi:hypothetical protein
MNSVNNLINPDDLGGLRLVASEILSAIDSYESSKDFESEATVIQAKIAKYAQKLYLETEDPLRHLFVVSSQVRIWPPCIHFHSLVSFR